MTVFGRDASNFDGTVTFDGLGFFTHKVTEGTSVVHDRYGPRLNAARAAGVPVLGSYHVLRTPGSGGAGSLAQQLAWWVAQMDLRTPWWRTHPHFMLQVDAERWPYDIVSPATVLAFADLVARAPLPGWPVTYASRGQYGNALGGIATPLWNADYWNGPGYPGDGWQPGWAPYSGQTPVLLQYTSTPYDKNAFRGTLEQLRALVGGHTPTTMGAIDMTPDEHNWLYNLYRAAFYGGKSCGPVTGTSALNPDPDGMANSVFDQLAAVRVDAKAAASLPTVVTLTDADRAAIAADVGSQVGARIDALAAQVGRLLTAVAAGDQAEADALKPPA